MGVSPELDKTRYLVATCSHLSPLKCDDGDSDVLAFTGICARPISSISSHGFQISAISDLEEISIVCVPF